MFPKAKREAPPCRGGRLPHDPKGEFGGRLKVYSLFRNGLVILVFGVVPFSGGCGGDEVALSDLPANPPEEAPPSEEGLGPVIESISPSCWVIGSTTVIDLTGDNFQEGAQVSIENLSASTEFVSSTHLTVSLPDDLSLDPLTERTIVVDVENPDQKTDSKVFSIQIASQLEECGVSPPDDEGGGHGNGEDGGDDQGEETCVQRVVESFEEEGSYDSGDILTLLGSIYEECLKGDDLVIYSIVPKKDDVAGGRWIWILGRGFDGDARVLFGDQEATEREVVTHFLIHAKVPPASSEGVVDISVQNPDGESTVREDAFTYTQSPEIGVYKGFIFQRNESVRPSILNLRVDRFKENERLGGEAQFEGFEMADAIGRKVLFECNPDWFDFEGTVGSKKAPFPIDIDLVNPEPCSILDESGAELGTGFLLIAIDNAMLDLDSDGEYHVLAASEELDIALECSWGECNEFEKDDFVFFMSRIGDL